MNFARRLASISLFGVLVCSALAPTGYQVKTNHPRLLITDVPEVARRYPPSAVMLRRTGLFSHFVCAAMKWSM